MNAISSRQLYFFLACIAPVGKLILLPAQLAGGVGNDLLFPALLHVFLQTGVIFCVMLLSRREQTLFSLLRNTFGKVGTCIACALLALLFLFTALLPMLEQKLLVQSVFYDTFPSLISFLPFFLLSAYFCAKPLLHAGRSWDILAPLSVVGFAGICILAAGSADFAALLPVGSAPPTAIASTFLSACPWFYDSALLLLFMGHFRYEKGMAYKSALFSLLGGACVLLFLALFYGVFDSLALRQTFAFAKMSKYFSAITVLGRIDYVFICLLSLVMTFYAILPLQAAVLCLQQTVWHKIRPSVLSVFVNLVMLTLTVLLDSSFQTVRNLMTETLPFVFLLFAVLLPLFALLLRRSSREKTS